MLQLYYSEQWGKLATRLSFAAESNFINQSLNSLTYTHRQYKPRIL